MDVENQEMNIDVSFNYKKNNESEVVNKITDNNIFLIKFKRRLSEKDNVYSWKIVDIIDLNKSGKGNPPCKDYENNINLKYNI